MEVSPEELHELLQLPGPRPFRLVDVRSSGDFIACRLHWAEFVPLDRLAAEAPQRFGEKTVPVVLYCRDGTESGRGCAVLEAMGYEFVFCLTGGLEAWKASVEPDFPLPGPSPQTQDGVSTGPDSEFASSLLAATKPPGAMPSLLSSSHDGEISPEDLQELMKQPGPRPFRLVDVREEDEFQICRLEWAELIPLSRLAEQAPRRLVDRDRPLVVYCHHGMRSQHACAWLRRAGYEQVLNLTGGIDAWADRVEPAMRRY